MNICDLPSTAEGTIKIDEIRRDLRIAVGKIALEQLSLCRDDIQEIDRTLRVTFPDGLQSILILGDVAAPYLRSAVGRDGAVDDPGSGIVIDPKCTADVVQRDRCNPVVKLGRHRGDDNTAEAEQRLYPWATANSFSISRDCEHVAVRPVEGTDDPCRDSGGEGTSPVLQFKNSDDEKVRTLNPFLIDPSGAAYHALGGWVWRACTIGETK